MIKEKEVDFRVHNNMIKFYEKKLNMNLSVGQIIKINIDDLSIGSHAKITTICDNCGREKIIEYRIYYKMSNGCKEKCYCQKCSGEKHKKTMMEKYGHEHALQCKEFKDKSEKTLMKNYGVTIPIRSKLIRDKFNKTIVERYGVENALENKEILDTLKHKMFEKHGMYFFETDEFKNKSKLTCLKNLGCENPSQNKNVRHKAINTCIKRYGFEYYLQNPELFTEYLKSSFRMKKYKNTDLYYQGLYEKDFLDLCEKLNILKFVKRGCTIRYNMNGKDLIYFPDFYIEKDNMLIEIKSSYWYNVHKEKNIIKERTCKELGYNYLLILDKNYTDFLSQITTDNHR